MVDASPEIIVMTSQTCPSHIGHGAVTERKT